MLLLSAKALNENTHLSRSVFLSVLATVSSSALHDLDFLVEPVSHTTRHTASTRSICCIDSTLSALVQQRTNISTRLLGLGKAVDTVDTLSEIVPVLATELHTAAAASLLRLLGALLLALLGKTCKVHFFVFAALGLLLSL
ncbi:hypothetical protein HG531_010337 [Fusarium graminearum]|nr:hypothetical protein HG531_010337 [Fusarium graminearum]